MQVRPAKPEDIPFIMDAWTRSWKESRWAGCIPNHVFHRVTKLCIEQLITRGAKIIVAVHEKNDRIMGFLCWEQAPTGETVIHSASVKSPYRDLRLNVFGGLLAATEGSKPGFYTHRTNYLEQAIRDLGPGDGIRNRVSVGGEGGGTPGDASARSSWVHAPEIARRK